MSVVPTVRHQGSLEKQGRLKTWSWKKYWFTLQDAQLLYMKEESNGGSRKRTSSSHGEINMNEAQSVKECHGLHHGFPFQIVTKSRTHILSADTTKSRDAWISVLHEAMLVKSRRSVALSVDSSLEQAEGDFGAYESISATPLKPDSGSPPNKPALHMSTSAMEKEPRCRSELLDNDSTYDSVFDAIQDKELIADSDSDGDCQYAEVVNALRPGEKKVVTTSSSTSKPGDNRLSETDTTTAETAAPPGSYSYVQMRTKTVKDYVQNSSSTASGDDYSDVYGDGENNSKDSKDTDTKTLSSTSETADAVSVVHSYAQVKPKSQRQLERQKSVESDNDSEDYDDVEVRPESSCRGNDDNNNAGIVPDLPHPRLELITKSAFDDIRRFLAKNRGPTEVYSTPPEEELQGQAIEKLRRMLQQLENDNGKIMRHKENGSIPRSVESTHL